MQIRWDAATYVWQRWVLNYDNEAQEGLLSRLLGGTESWRLTLWLIGFGLAIAAVFAWMLTRNHKPVGIRREVRAINKLERQLAQLGYHRLRGETLGDFIDRIVQSAPHHRAALANIHRLFVAIAYQSQSTKLEQLERAVKQFPAH